MKYFWSFLFLLFVFSSVAQQEKIIAAGSGNPQIVRIDKATGKVEWSHFLEQGEECNSVAVTDNGNLLYSYKKGAKLITPDHQVVWDYIITGNEEVQSASLLKNGNYLLGICGNPARLVEIDKSGKPVNQIRLDLEIEKPHSQFRQVRELRNGNYLLPVLSRQKLMEISKNGKVIAEYPISGSPFSVLEKKDGSLLLSLGDAHAYSIFDKALAKEIGRIEENDIPGVKLLFVAQILEMENGNLLICNWHGHTKDASVDEPQFIEIDKNCTPVWSLNDKENIGKISAACLTVF